MSPSQTPHRLLRVPRPLFGDGHSGPRVDERGHAHFNYLQNYLNTKRPLVYYVFDLLYLKDRNLMDVPLRERKALLRKLLPKPGIVRYVLAISLALVVIAFAVAYMTSV